MLKKTILFFILSFNLAFSQDLYIDDNSFLYAQDVVLYVNNDIRLETPTSNLYFRGNAQLVQEADIKNSDSGELSIYQNQTTGVYEYNYFCSPVGVSDTSLNTNVNFNGSTIHDPADDTDLTNVSSTPYLYTTAYEGTTTQLSNYWLYSLKDGEGYYSWKQIFDTGDTETGYGFTLKGSPNPNNVLDFRGRPNNGTITISCTFDGIDNQPSGTPNTVVTLTGNPYPSALDLKKFIIENTSVLDGGTGTNTVISGDIFFWEQKQTNTHYLEYYEGGYGVYTPGDLSNLSDNGTYTIAPFQNYNADGSGNTNTTGNTTDFSTNNSRRFAAVGQGFLIQSNGLGGNVTFNNAMRLYLPEDSTPSGDGSVFSKTKQAKTGKTNKKTVAMSHNGIDYKSILEQPTIIPEIKIHTHINNTFYKENVIAFRKNTPNNNTFNRFFDGANINELSNDAYLISNNKELVIKSINYNEDTRLPLGLKASADNTQFNIKIHKLKDVPELVEVYIYDNENQTYTNIKHGAFNITLNKGIYNNRFEVTFKQNSTLNTTENITKNFKVFQNNSISQLNIFNHNRLNIESLSLFDASGKEILTDHLSSNVNKHSYSTKLFSDGVYIVKINLGNNQVFSKKVIVSNKN